MTHHDLVVADATLRGRDGRWQIGIDGDRIAVRHPGATRRPRGGRRGGALVTESFVNGHLHLDKVHTLDRVGDAALMAYTAGDMGSALTSIELASAVKADYDRDWIEPNARRAVLEAVRHGVRHVLAFADVDTKARLEGVIPLLALREEFRGVVDLQVVAFPQDGLLCDPGAEELVREAVDLGADVVGGIPWIEHTDAEAREHVRRMCAWPRPRPPGGDARRRRRRRLASAPPRCSPTAMLEHGLVGRGVANQLGPSASTPDRRWSGWPGSPAGPASASSPTRTPARCTCPSAS